MSDPDKAKALMARLEKTAKEIEQPSETKMADEIKDKMQWHCSSRAAGIRDAIQAIKIEFGL